MHLHDAKGKSAHLPLGTAEVEIERKISMLKNGETCLLEVKTIQGLSDSVDFMRKNNFM